MVGMRSRASGIAYPQNMNKKRKAATGPRRATADARERIPTTLYFEERGSLAADGVAHDRLRLLHDSG
jgi:hypothetical protein